MGLRKTIFGRVKSKPNTFIGGIAETINTPALLATKIGVSASQIKNFKVVGNDIQFKINIIYQIPSNAFNGNTNITYFNDSEGYVKSLGTRSFYNCTSLLDFTADSLESIADSAFYNCKSITSYSFPKVTAIDSQSIGALGTFRNNTSLLSFHAPLLTSITGTGRCFEGASKMTAFYAPNLAGSIALASFSGCAALNEFTVGPITSIGGGCFSDCSSLTSLTFNSLNALTGVNTFSNCSGLKYFSANSLKDTPAGTFIGCISLENVYIASSVSIPSNCFHSFDKLKSIDISSVKTIASRAFYNCTSLLDFTADSLESVDESAFYNCKSITSYSFPKVTAIDSQSNISLGTFRNNTSLLTFHAPLLTSITGTGRCFEGTSKMTAFYAPNLAGSIALASFSGCAALNEFTVGPITSIGGGCFSDCPSLTSLILNHVTSIGTNAFYNCTGINNISLRALTICGDTTTNNNVFFGIKLGCNITVPVALQTANAGAPDGDLVYAQTSRNAIINYI